MEKRAPGKGFYFVMLLAAAGLGLLLIAANVYLQQAQKEELIDYLGLSLVDKLLESGVLIPPVDYADPLLLETRTIVINTEINEKTSKEVAAKLLYLDRTRPGEPIELVIKTYGGWQEDAYLICDTMQLLNSPVNTWSAGLSASAGAMILAAGTGVRRALPNAMIMVHVVEEEDEDPLSFGYQSRRRSEEFWRRHARLPAQWYPMTGDVEYYLDAGQALKYGIIDEIYGR